MTRQQQWAAPRSDPPRTGVHPVRGWSALLDARTVHLSRPFAGLALVVAGGALLLALARGGLWWLVPAGVGAVLGATLFSGLLFQSRPRSLVMASVVSALKGSPSDPDAVELSALPQLGWSHPVLLPDDARDRPARAYGTSFQAGRLTGWCLDYLGSEPESAALRVEMVEGSVAGAATHLVWDRFDLYGSLRERGLSRDQAIAVLASRADHRLATIRVDGAEVRVPMASVGSEWQVLFDRGDWSAIVTGTGPVPPMGVRQL